jgi:hypothetical protein
LYWKASGKLLQLAKYKQLDDETFAVILDILREYAEAFNKLVEPQND